MAVDKCRLFRHWVGLFRTSNTTHTFRYNYGMALTNLIVWLTPDDYDAVKQLAPDDPDLPDTYDMWLKQETVSISGFDEQHLPYKKVTINSDGLARYCESSGITCDGVGRRAYAVVLHRRSE